jgi:hypothetical protein
MLVDNKWGQVVMCPAIFTAILIVREYVDEIVPAVIPPGNRPLAVPFGIVLGVLASSTIPAFQVACGIYY